MQPALVGAYRMRALSVLDLGDGMVATLADDFFFLDFGVGDVVNQGPADSSAASGIDKSVLRAGVEGIFSVDELRMQADVALL